jgi:large subunit ribosomal protein L30
MRLRVQQKKSSIGCQANQRATLRALGLRRIGDTVLKQDRPEIRGMVHTVRHLVTVTELEDDGPADDGSADDGPADDGPADDGPADDGPADEGAE